MKRTATEAFGGAAAAAQAPAFQPTGAALLDPKAYFAQWCQQAAAAPISATAIAGSVPAAASEKSDMHKQVEEASAVKCAGIVKEKGQNFTTGVAIEALCTMATKSSFKLREELYKQAHVKRLCKRVQELVSRPPSGFGLDTLSRAVWCLSRFPNEVLGDDKKVTLSATARALSSADPTSWKVDDASKVLWVLAKADIIQEHKALVSKVVSELVRDQGRRANQLSHEGLMNLLHAVARARRHIKKGDLQTVHTEAADQELFQIAGARVMREIEEIDVRLLADLIHTHNETGLRNEPLFRAVCPKIVAKEKELNTDAMGKVIKAYTRFMIPLREEQQGFRTMAIVAKGDFIRPSEKPKREGRKTYDHPVALYEKTQLHARG